MTTRPWTSPHGEPGHYSEVPDESRPAFCLVDGLSFNPSGHSFRFGIGDRLEHILPADVLAACVKDGRASYTAPE